MTPDVFHKIRRRPHVRRIGGFDIARKLSEGHADAGVNGDILFAVGAR